MKKQWISVKCGLSRDPKHRRQMGKTVWTFLHMLDLADWETGIVYDWKDENAAEDMGIDIRVLREDRRQLEKEDYISCKQKQYGQDITIHNWTNPREYTGEVYNKKQGYKKLPPSNNAQGDAQGDAQGSIKDVTPTLDSNNKESIKPSKIKGIEASIYSGRPTTSDDLPLMELALKEFEAALSLPHNWQWYPAKTSDESAWRELREFIFSEWQADNQTFRKYASWRATPYSRGTVSNLTIQRKPTEFITSWSDYLASSSMYGKESSKLEDSGWK